MLPLWVWKLSTKGVLFQMNRLTIAGLCTLSLSIVMTGCFSQMVTQGPELEDPVVMNVPDHVPEEVPADEEPVKLVESQESLYLSYINRLLQQGEPFRTEEDLKLINQIPVRPLKGSVEEAALAIGLVRHFISSKETNRSFGQSGLEIGSEVPETQGMGPDSLEQILAEREFELSEALVSNPMLKSHSFQMFLLKAVRLGKNQSPEFLAGLRESIRKNSEEWSRLSQDLDSVGAPQEGEENIPADAEAGVEAAPALAFGEEVFSGDESKIREAQGLTEQGQYQEAVEILRAVPGDSLYQAEAQSKIREISNIAVQDLRRKAARAFQSARPISDHNTRAAYLKDAKKFLEQALEVFPESDQLHTVRQNLNVINKSLELMGSHRSGQAS